MFKLFSLIIVLAVGFVPQMSRGEESTNKTSKKNTMIAIEQEIEFSKDSDEALKNPEEIEYNQYRKEQNKLAKSLQYKHPGLTKEQALQYAEQLKEYKAEIDNQNNNYELSNEPVALDP